MRYGLALLLLVAAVTAWIVETTTRTGLVGRLEALRQGNRAAARIREEHERLLRREPFVGEIETLRRDAAEAANLRRELQLRDQPDRSASPDAGVGQSSASDWTAIAAMKNAGRATPQAALETIFWAAANGDEATVAGAIAFDRESRQCVDELLSHSPTERLPGRGAAEIVVARSLIQHAPAGEMQLVAEQWTGFDEAVEYLALRGTNLPAAAVHLRLMRNSDGWRLLVPKHVVEAIGREIGGLPPVAVTDPFRDAPHLPEP